MPKKCRQITEMMRGGQLRAIPNTFIDAYNHTQRAGITSAIKCNIDSSDLYYVTVKKKRTPAD